MKAVLSIAGSDSSGGAGIQADIKTIAAHGLFAETAITALTAQNTTGVLGVVEVEPEFVMLQIDAVFTDIRPAAVKVGMVSSPEIARAIAASLVSWHAENIVVDPVMVATSGARLISEGAAAALVGELMPHARVATPNLPEAEALVGRSLEGRADMEAAAREIAQRVGCSAVLLKGGHGKAADDVLVEADGTITWFEGERIDTTETHGTGCTLSSAIACGLASGLGVVESVRAAKRYVTGAIAHAPHLGRGCGPLDHMWEHRG